MKKVKSREQIIEEYQVKRIVIEEFDKQAAPIINAAFAADLSIHLLLLIDHYEAEPEWIKEYLDLYNELLDQYNSGKFNMGKIRRHIKEVTGVDPVEFIKKTGARLQGEENDG